MNRVFFIINPTSGVRRNLEQVSASIHRHWGSACPIAFTMCRGHGFELAREAAEQGVGLVVAVGGDGTVNEVASALVGTETALGIVPAGSGNGFARNLGIPLNHQAAIRRLQAPILRALDVGRINGRFFFNVAGIGLDAEISARFGAFGLRGHLPYFMIGVREFLRYRPEPVSVRWDGGELRGRPLLVSVANAPQYGSGAVIAPDARPDDGLLDLCWLESVSSLEALLNLRRLFDGTIDRWEAMRICRTRHAVLRRSRGGFAHTDGDAFRAGAVLNVEVLAGQLKVAVGEGWGLGDGIRSLLP